MRRGDLFLRCRAGLSLVGYRVLERLEWRGVEDGFFVCFLFVIWLRTLVK